MALVLLALALKPQASIIDKISNSSLEVNEIATEEPYNGKIYHIFFHSLILYPELAFSGQRAKQYNDWMTTRKEFIAILDKLYNNDFVLADIEEVRKAKVNGKPFMFPKDKKPLIISVDDVNYYDYMINDGFAEKLVIDDNGIVANLVKTPQNNYVIDYQGDVMPILNAFVEKYPDFSHNGAKGIVAVTGYQGVFGYRITSLIEGELEQAKFQAMEVATKLKQNGWQIACHSYSHSIKFKDGSISLASFKSDIEKWQQHIAPIVGNTNIFIAPFGTQFATNSAQFDILAQYGFDIYCSVCKNMKTSTYKGFLINERLNFDGFTMLKYPSRITESFFDLTGIVDPIRYLVV